MRCVLLGAEAAAIAVVLPSSDTQSVLRRRKKEWLRFSWVIKEEMVPGEGLSGTFGFFADVLGKSWRCLNAWVIKN